MPQQRFPCDLERDPPVSNERVKLGIGKGLERGEGVVFILFLFFNVESILIGNGVNNFFHI